MCCPPKAKQKHTSVYPLIVYVYNGNLLWQMSDKEVKFKVHYGGTFLWNPSLEYFGEKVEIVYKDLIGLVILKYKVYMRN